VDLTAKHYGFLALILEKRKFWLLASVMNSEILWSSKRYFASYWEWNKVTDHCA